MHLLISWQEYCHRLALNPSFLNRSAFLHTSSGFDRSVVNKGDEFTLANDDDGTVKVNSGIAPYLDVGKA